MADRTGPKGCGTACKGAVSPSQLDTYRRMCARRWGFEKLAKLPTPTFQFQTDGIETHAHLEAYSKFAQLPPTDRQPGIVALKMIPHVPTPDPAHRCEEHVLFEYQMPDHSVNVQGALPGTEAHKAGFGGASGATIKFHGYPDLEPAVAIKDSGTIVGAIIDYKTISVGRERFKYVKDWDTLAWDSQCLVYGMWLVLSQDVDYVNYKWIYAERSKPFGVKVIEGTLTRAQIIERFEAEILPAAWDMNKHKFNLSGERERPQDGQPDTVAIEYVNDNLKLYTDPGACGAYGGCPFLEHCIRPVVSAKEKLMSGMKDMQSRLNQIKGAPAGSPAPNPRAAAPAVRPAAVAAQPAGHAVNPPAQRAAAPVARAPAPAQRVAAPAVRPVAAPAVRRHPQQAPVAVAEEPTVDEETTYQYDADGNLVSTEEVYADEAPAAPEPARRKRRTKAEMDAERAATAEQEPVYEGVDENSAPESAAASAEGHILCPWCHTGFAVTRTEG